MPSLDEIKVLDHGFVYLVDHMGDDSRIVQAARVSYGSGTKTKSQDDKLIDYLMRNNHTSPFEKVVFEFHIKCPIFVARQWRTYRTGSFNELSARYSEMDEEFYLPSLDKITTQDSKNRQARTNIVVDEAENAKDIMDSIGQTVYGSYKHLLNLGVARELARIVLPLSMYTEFYWTVNLHNLFHFIHQRDADDAQWEIAEYARAIRSLIQPIVPAAYKSFVNKYG